LTVTKIFTSRFHPVLFYI